MILYFYLYHRSPLYPFNNSVLGFAIVLEAFDGVLTLVSRNCSCYSNNSIHRSTLNPYSILYISIDYVLEGT